MPTNRYFEISEFHEHLAVGGIRTDRANFFLGASHPLMSHRDASWIDFCWIERSSIVARLTAGEHLQTVSVLLLFSSLEHLTTSTYRIFVEAKMITPSVADLVDLFDAKGAFIFGRPATYCHPSQLISCSRTACYSET